MVSKLIISLFIKLLDKVPLWLDFFFFFLLLFGCPRPTLGHSQGRSLTNLMLITAYVHIRPEGHREPCNEVGSLSPAKHLAGFEPGTFWFLLQCLNPLGHSPFTLYKFIKKIYCVCLGGQTFSDPQTRKKLFFKDGPSQICIKFNWRPGGAVNKGSNVFCAY